jgi:UDP-2,3-diacylglucosamine pyrophosphatase LpxH
MALPTRIQLPNAVPSTWANLLALSADGRLDSLIVSDLHLGLRGSRSGELLKLLQVLRFGRALRHRAGGPDVLLVSGNHDRACGDLLARLLDRPVADSVTWTHAGRRFLAVHGDLFDRFVTRHRRTAGVVSSLFGFCQRRLSLQGRWPHAVDQLHVRLTGLGRRMAEAALAHARLNGADVIFCGHTHQPYARSTIDHGSPARPLTYLNTGAWLGIRPSLVTVAHDGSARLHQFA